MKKEGAGMASGEHTGRGNKMFKSLKMRENVGRLE